MKLDAFKNFKVQISRVTHPTTRIPIYRLFDFRIPGSRIVKIDQWYHNHFSDSALLFLFIRFLYHSHRAPLSLCPAQVSRNSKYFTSRTIGKIAKFVSLSLFIPIVKATNVWLLHTIMGIMWINKWSRCLGRSCEKENIGQKNENVSEMHRCDISGQHGSRGRLQFTLHLTICG